MNTQELINFIKELKKSNSVENGYFGFFYDEETHEYSSYVKANKEGLRLFASELLEASTKIKEKGNFSLSSDWNHNNSDLFLTRIEFSEKLRSELDIKKREYRQTWKDQLGVFIAIGVVVFILISILIGVGTIINWLF